MTLETSPSIFRQLYTYQPLELKIQTPTDVLAENSAGEIYDSEDKEADVCASLYVENLD